MAARHRTRRTVLYLTRWNVQALHEGIVAYAHEAGWILDNTCQSTIGMGPKAFRESGTVPDFGVVPASVFAGVT